MPGTPKRSRAARELDRILDEKGRCAKAIKKAFHRTHLWRLKTGRRTAELKTASLIEQKSKGRIPASWWLEV